jgi:AraC-like DNA-binding protein
VALASLLPPQPETFAGVPFSLLPSGVSAAPHYVSRDLAVTKWRCHEAAHSISCVKQQPWHVLSFVHSGSFRIRGPRGKGVADPTEILAFRPGEPYETEHTGRCGDYGSGIILSAALADELLPQLASRTERDPWRAPLRPLAAANLARQVELLRRLDEGAGADAIGRLGVDETLLDLVTRVLAPATAQEAAPPARGTRERVAAAQEILERRYREPLRLDDLACEVGLSPFHLCRQFRRQTGWTIHRYLTHLRIAEGLERLSRAPRCSLLELALDLGFDGHSHFSDVFRRLVGRSPSAFRAAAAH